MNFSYDSFDYSQNIYQRKIEKKVEEQEKGKVEEEKVAEEPKPRTMEISEGVLRKTDEIVISYAKAAMQIPENINNIKPEVVEDLPREGETLEQLIANWGDLSNDQDATFEQKIDLLTRIIDAFGEDEEGARIWRARRYTLCHQQHIQAQLAYLQDLGNGATYDPNAVPSPNVFDGDYQAAAYLREHYNELGDAEKLVVDEEYMLANTVSFLGILISLKNPNCTNADELKALANVRIIMIMNYYMNRALDNPENAGDWPVYNNQFIPKFNEFQDIMTHPEQHGIYYLQAINTETGNVVAVNGNITTLVSELTDIIDTLRDSGFPYCDELLVCIQGYLAYAGFNSINVLTPGEGNAKPEVADPKKKVAQSTTNLK